MTPLELDNHLSNESENAELVFVTQNGPVSGGYHLTEFKSSKVNSIDCGGRASSWNESAMQILDGSGGTSMSVKKFRSILKKAIQGVEGFSGSDLTVEYGQANKSMSLFEIGKVSSTAGQLVVELSSGGAVCKPLEEAKSNASVSASCCGTPASGSCC